MIATTCTPVLEKCTVLWCRKPWPGHPRGCPNWRHAEGCPPGILPLPRILDLSQPVWLLVNEYDLGDWAARMRARHPEWSDAQCRNPRHWQGTARAQLWRAVEAWQAEHPDQLVVPCPEASRVDVTATCAGAGIVLEWPARIIARQVVLAGTPTEAMRERLAAP